MLRLAPLFVAAILACGAGCQPPDDGTVAGHWRSTRSVASVVDSRTDPNRATCPTMTLPDLHIVIDPSETQMLSGVDQQLFDDGPPYDGGPQINFMTREMAFGAARPLPIYIHHDLAMQGSQMSGTGWAESDGSIDGCRYMLSVAAARE